MKNLRNLKKMSLLGAAALGLLVMVPTTSSAANTTATLHVNVNVVNSYGGTAVPSDFTLHIRYLMKEVAGSPFKGAGGSGTTFVLAPGSYLITDNDVEISNGFVTYYGNYRSANIIQGQGFVTLAAGDDVTVTRNEYDWPVAGLAAVQPTASPIPATTTETSAPAVPSTQVGGTLPKTSSPWYNMLAISFGLVLLGSIGFKTRKAFK